MTGQDCLCLHIPRLSRVEAQAGLELSLQKGVVESVSLCMREPPRLIEKLMEGYGYEDAVEIVARLRGSCPVTNQLCAVQAIEDAFGLDPGPGIRNLRRAMHCGEWLQSHSRHIHILAAPDFLAVDNVFTLAKKHPDELRRGLRLQMLGRDLVALFGGRSVHPVGLRVGGFHRAPPEPEVESMCRRLEAALPDAEALVRWCAGLVFPQQRQVFTSVGLTHDRDYGTYSGQIISGSGAHLHIREFASHLARQQVPYSTLLQNRLEGQAYLVGPLARVNLNLHQLPEPVLENLHRTAIAFPSHNMFHSILARAVEVHFAIVEALRLLADYRAPATSGVAVIPRAGAGVGCVESPAGLVWHRYELGPDGRIESARTLGASGQNQARVEEDLTQALPYFGLERDAAELRGWAARVVRNYDL